MENILLALSLSVDALGIGMAYGVRSIKVTNGAKFVIFAIAVFVMSLSMAIGRAITIVAGAEFGKFAGAATLIALGISVIFQSVLPAKEKFVEEKSKNKEVSIIIKSLGITIKIIHEPQNADADSNSVIEKKEARLLGVALSIDSLGLGLAMGAIGMSPMYLPLLSGFFQIILLSSGLALGLRFAKFHTSGKMWNMISGVTLIGIGLLRLI